MGEKKLARNALLVDDSKSARFVLGKLLQQHDFSVEMAASAEDALEFLKTHRPDAVFMDHMMKGMDGLVATSLIKKNPATAHIPVVMCTSNDGEEYRAEAKSYGALGTLVKPPSDEKLEEILIAINKAIDNNQPALETFRQHPVSHAEMAGSGYAEQRPEAAESLTEAQIESIVDASLKTRIALIEESLEAQLKQQDDVLETLIEQKIDAAAATAGSASMSKQEISDFLDERLAKMSELMADQLLELKQQLAAEVINSAKISRHVQEIAMETAFSAAEEKADVIARKLAQSTQSSTREATNPALEMKINKQISEVEKSAKSQALTFSVMAAIVGAGTAAALFFLAL